MYFFLSCYFYKKKIPDKVSYFLSGSKLISPSQPEEDKSILSADIIETGW